MKIRLFSSSFVLIISIFLICGCVDPYYSGSGGGYREPSYGHSGYGGYDNGYGSYEDRRDRRERKELERERDRLEDERRRLEEERRNRPVYSPPPPPRHVEEHCPSGYSPSENKCSQEERRRGCKDMRLPGGLGCVHR